MKTKFRKKPVVIDAIQWLGDFDAIRAFMEGDEEVIFMNDGAETLDVPTLEGRMTARPNDWIIRGVKGEVYPIKDEIFRMTYEPIE